MALGGVGRAAAAPLLILNLIFSSIILGISGWMLNRDITKGGFGGNAASPYLSLFSLIAGMASIAAVIAGLHYLRTWGTSSVAAAQATSWLAWLLLILAFCLAWKEIRMGGRSVRHKVLEAFVIILTATEFLYTLLLHFGDHSASTTNTGTGHHGKLGTNTPPAATAV